MARLIPDWILYLLALGAVLYVIFSASSDYDAPRPHPDALELEGAMLPPASPFDDRILVQVSRPKDGIGTAFAINEDGTWLTARHVVEGCESVSLLVAPERYLPVDSVVWSSTSDLALLKTESSPNPVVLNTGADMRVGEFGYHVGYPQGRPGEAVSRLVSRSRLITDGERQGNEGVLTWTETGRTQGLSGALGGLSGGPVFDDLGRVRGVIIAESPRRGRIFTAAPEAIEAFLTQQAVTLAGDRPRPYSPETYGREADMARRQLQVVKVACEVDDFS